MITRHSGYIVVLQHDTRDDSPEVEGILNALRMVKGVHSVVPVIASETSEEDHNITIANTKQLSWIKEKLLGFVKEL